MPSFRGQRGRLRVVMMLEKDVVLGFLEGHRRANELVRAEKKRRLSELSIEDSLREYDTPCKMWEANPNSDKEGLERLERQKILFLVERRKRLNKVSGLK